MNKPTTTTIPPHPALLPCPFCNTSNPTLQTYGPCNEDEEYTNEYLSTHTFFSYRCSNTLCWAEAPKCYPAEEAIKAWNTRADRALIGELVEALEFVIQDFTPDNDFRVDRDTVEICRTALARAKVG